MSAPLRIILKLLLRNEQTVQEVSRKNCRILVIRVDEFGDVFLTIPFLRELKRNFSESEITLVVRPELEALFSDCPWISEVLPYAERLVSEKTARPLLFSLSRLWRAVRFAKQELRSKAFDIALLPRWDTDFYGASELIALSGAKRRIGFSEKVTPFKARFNKGADGLFSEVCHDGSGQHEVLRALSLLTSLGIGAANSQMEYWLNEDDLREATRRLEAQGIPAGTRIIALGISAREAKKRWPLERYQALTTRLLELTNCYVVLLAGKDVREVSKQIFTDGRIKNLCGITTWRETFSILALSTVYVGNNTATLHAAAAVGTPTIEISCHPKDGDDEFYLSPARFGAWQEHAVVVQPDTAVSPCGIGCLESEAHCILQNSVDAVVEKVLPFLERR